MPPFTKEISSAYEDINATFVGRGLDSSQVIDVLALGIVSVIKQYPPEDNIMFHLQERVFEILNGRFQPPPPVRLVPKANTDEGSE
jgi:hypothetical protein